MQLIVEPAAGWISRLWRWETVTAPLSGAILSKIGTGTVGVFRWRDVGASERHRIGLSGGSLTKAVDDELSASCP
jgi:hypothetical protein